MKMKKLQPLLVLALGALVITGCKGKGGNSNNGSSGGDDTPTRDPLPGAQGVQNFVYSSVEERTNILGALETYAVENKLTGLTLFNNGGYVMYHPGVVKGAANFIPGYGFGILAEGDLNADLEGETNAAWKRFYHIFESEDPQQVNAMNSQEATVSDVQGYMTSGYFGVRMNETKDGYDWVAGLAKQNRPTPLNANELGLATKYRFEVKVGAELKYSTNTENTALAAFNNREVELQDYVTPYKILYTQAYGMVRSGESLSGTGSIKGRSAYYSASKQGFNEEAWASVGVKAYVEDGKNYLEFEFNNSCTPFYAMYYLASGMMAPVPESFITALGDGDFAAGINVWGASNTAGTLKPVDTWLSTGPYTLSRWDADQQIVLVKNPNYDDQGRYKIQGVHINILKAAATNTEAGLNEFLANKLHAVGIPSTRLDEFKNDPRATTTVGDSNFKLNLNTCDQATWNKLFGENGTVEQTPEADYWECEPAMANKDFVSGISFAFDRQEYAKSLGRNPAFDFFAPTYLSDPENGVSYNSTPQHKAAVKSLQEGTDGYGYSKELATQAFIRASKQLIADGFYKEGDEIEIEIAWQYAFQEATYHNPLKKYIEDAFNVDENPLTLKINFWVGNEWSDVYDAKMMIGQYDIGFGSISGNEYDPLDFMHTLSTDPSINQGYAMSWGIDTNANDLVSIQYNGASWSFDGLYKAATSGAYIVDGKNSPLFTLKSCQAEAVADGSIKVSGTFEGANLVEGEGDQAELLAYGTVAAICVYGGGSTLPYEEFYVYNTDLFRNPSDDPTDEGNSLVVDDEKGEFVATFSPTISAYFRTKTDRAGFDVYSFTYLAGDQNLAYYGTPIEELPEPVTPAQSLI